MSESAAYRIHGLDCAEEVAVLKREVGARAGVLGLEFDILNARMSVAYDPARIAPSDIVAAVRATGMRAVPWRARAEQERGPFWAEHGRFAMAVASGVLLLAGFASHWALHGGFVHALAMGEGGDLHAFPAATVLLYLGAVAAGGWFVVPKAFGALRRLRPDMNLLMVLAVVGAAAIGQWFEAGTVTFLFAVAQWLESWSVGRARRAVTGLLDLSPPVARRVCPHHGDLHEEPVAEIDVGALVLVRPGERIPLDGEVTEGASSVNQAPITGESAPASKRPGDPVYAGTINGDGALTFRVTKRASDTTLARIIHMVQEAHGRRARSEQWVERFARVYTPAMLGLALGLAVFPPLAMGGGWLDWLYRALVVLVIACPCALVISTPVSIVAGLTAAARNGVLIKGGVHLEAAGRLRALALDKTGTLTNGRPEVQGVEPLNGHTVMEVLERAAALEAHSEHPFARAILRRAEAEGIRVAPAAELRSIPGKGAEAVLAGRRFWIGSDGFMREKHAENPEVHSRADALEDAGHSVVALGNDNHVCGLISVADGVRRGAREAVAALRRAGLQRIVMLTGDNEGTARAVAGAVGVDEHRAELMPADKVAAVEALVRDVGRAGMVGDGVNDAPAMAASSLGIAMGAMGSDAAIETADVALMADDLSKLPWLIRHSRRTLAVIQCNIALAVGIKAVFLVLALFGLASLWTAIMADMGTSLLVIFNGLRLLGPPRGGGRATPETKVTATG